MKFFVDTANFEDIKKLYNVGIIDGVTTNPTLIYNSGKEIRPLLFEICELVKGPISAETVSTDYKNMVSEGLWLREISNYIVVKVPLTVDGIKACKILESKGHPVNVTLCFSANQALLAAKANASYISPFVGRLDDIAEDGMILIKEIREIYDNYNFNTKILTASARSPLHILKAAKIGSDVITAPPNAIWQMFKHPLPDVGLKKFINDWSKTGQKIG